MIEDYEHGLVRLEAQDPSLRCRHHYLRRGDLALTGADSVNEGIITVDGDGLAALIEAAVNLDAQNVRDDPVLGLGIIDYTSGEPHSANVRRADEVWSTVLAMTRGLAAPDFDVAPVYELPSYLYAVLVAMNDFGNDLFPLDPDNPLTGDVIFEYASPLDNATAVSVTPERPTTHCHVIDADDKARRTAADIAASNRTGVFVDWIASPFHLPADNDTSVLYERAKAQVAAYGRPVKHTTIELGPDAGRTYSYGNWDWPGESGGFYVGDRVLVRATRGYRSLDQVMRITRATLKQPGSNGLVTTQLKLIPVVAGDPVDEEDS